MKVWKMHEVVTLTRALNGVGSAAGITWPAGTTTVIVDRHGPIEAPIGYTLELGDDAYTWGLHEVTAEEAQTLFGPQRDAPLAATFALNQEFRLALPLPGTDKRGLATLWMAGEHVQIAGVEGYNSVPTTYMLSIRRDGAHHGYAFVTAQEAPKALADLNVGQPA